MQPSQSFSGRLAKKVWEVANKDRRVPTLWLRGSGQAGKPPFRPDLEGLRAVAVVLIVLYHINTRLAPGGYVGVDVFYVLSGYFITGLLLHEWETRRRISLRAFYARRMRRILPAAALVIAVTCLFSYLVLPPLRFAEVGRDAVASALYVSNFRFAIARTSYLSYNLSPSPFLHYWSLGVEEQFYLFWPLLIGLTLYLGSRKMIAKKVAGLVIVGISAASLFCSVWLTGLSQPWAFFTLPSRVWELGVGALLALAFSMSYSLADTVRKWADWLGLGIIVFSAYYLSDNTAFPGYAVILPVAGSALVIAGGVGNARCLLSWRPMRAIGRWSYSIYLWHWPLLVLMPIYLSRPLRWEEKLVMAVFTVAISAVSYRLVEMPIRSGRWLSDRTWRGLALGLALSGSAALVGVALLRQPIPVGEGSVAAPTSPPTISTLAKAANTKYVPANLDPSLTKSDQLPLPYSDGCHLAFTDVRSGLCRYADLSSLKTVVLFGDSHAAQWFPAVETAARTNRWRLENLTKSACAANTSIPPSPYEPGSKYTECTVWHHSILKRLKREHPQLIILSSNIPYFSKGLTRKQILTGLARMIDEVRPLADYILVLGDVPHMQFQIIAECLSEHMQDATACTTPRAQAVDTKMEQSMRRIAQTHGATYVSTSNWICPGKTCPVIVGNLLTYREGGHIEPAFARLLAPHFLPFLPSPNARVSG